MGRNDWPQYEEWVVDAVVNKCGDFYTSNGIAGLFAYIGGRHTLTLRTYPDNSPAWIRGTDQYNAAWDMGHLVNMGKLLNDSNKFIDQAWALITSYTGKDIFGIGAYYYGQSPPMPQPDPEKVLWNDGNQYVITK